MIALQQELYKIVAGEASSQANLLLISILNDSGIKQDDGSPVTGLKMVQRLWHANPNRDLAERIYNLSYGPRDDGTAFKRMQLDIIVNLHIWFPVDKESDYTQKGKGTVPMVHFVGSILRNKFREKVRSLCGDPPHGVKVSITKRKGECDEDGNTSRRKKRFSFATNVKGWCGPKHKAWMDEKKENPSLVSPLFVCTLHMFSFCTHLRSDRYSYSQPCHHAGQRFYYYYYYYC
jgi:hypothetical protein